MKVGDKTVIRATAQTWGDLVPQAKHWHAVLENTETTWSKSYSAWDSEKGALREATNEFLKEFDLERYILVLGASQGDMCLDWN